MLTFGRRGSARRGAVPARAAVGPRWRAPAKAFALVLPWALVGVPASSCTRDVRLLQSAPLPNDGGRIDADGAPSDPAPPDTPPPDAFPDAPGPDLGPATDGPVDGLQDGADGADGATRSCTGVGNPVRFMTAAGSTCAGTMAARAHRTAICSCSDWNVAGAISIMNTTSVPGNVPARVALGINGNFTSTSDVTVPGAVYVSGTKGVMVTPRFDIVASLRSGGPIAFVGAGQASVASDVFAAGDVTGPARITGTLHLPAGALVGAATLPTAVVREPVTVAPPCDCAPPFDVSAAIAAAMTTNDNGTMPVDRLANVTTTATTRVDLSCGTYAFSSISILTSLTLAVHGRAVMAVAGDVLVQRSLSVAFDQAVPGATLDLLLQGSFTVNGGPTFVVGTSNAEQLRIWMVGPGPINVPSAPVMGGVFHAPAATLMAPRGLTLIGSVTAGALMVGGQVNISYDDAILASGTSCGDPKVEPLP